MCQKLQKEREHIEQKLRESGYWEKYHRFEIGPVDHVGPNDFRSVGEIIDVTQKYLAGVKPELERVAVEIKGRGHLRERNIRPRFSEISSSPEPEPEPASSKKISGQEEKEMVTRLSAKYIHPKSLFELLQMLFNDQFSVVVSRLRFFFIGTCIIFTHL